MGAIRIARLDEDRQFVEMKAAFEELNPGIRLSLVEVDGEAGLRSDYGGMRVFWVYRGAGEVFLPRGYRTQEGDGRPLPDEYRPDALTPTVAEALKLLKGGLATMTAAALTPARAIVVRWKNDAFVGDIAGDLWKLVQTPRPWSSDPQVEAALDRLFGVYRQIGYSTKQVDSYEPIQAGDQLTACPREQVWARGHFQCLAMENIPRETNHTSTARRLRYLVDSAGGCNPDFDPFRRLPLTWFANCGEEAGDGLNWVNSHVVNIPKETSPTHFHPPKPTGGGAPQSEMYLTLDPAAYQLSTWGRPASFIVFPDLRDLCRYEQHPLEPGMFVHIPPGTGHRALDAFVNVLTIPGFKPNNEYYLDRDIRDQAAGRSPFNENLLEIKNYERIEDLL
jgi:hypothetical protein